MIFSPPSQSIDKWSEYGEISPLLLFKTVIVILISSLFFMSFDNKNYKFLFIYFLFKYQTAKK